jgi:hypothetical protein
MYPQALEGTYYLCLFSLGELSFLEAVDIYYDKAAKLASTTPDILAQIKVCPGLYT